MAESSLYAPLQQMEKLDSYMKQTMRFYPPELTTSFSHQTLRGITLTSGEYSEYIPLGTFVETPSSQAIYKDDANYPKSNTVDRFQLYKLRRGGHTSQHQHARNQFVTVDEQNLVFGYGRQACNPGRLLASTEIKMILMRMLLVYDFKNFTTNVGGGDDVMGRYHQNHEAGRVVNLLDVTKPLLVKKVNV